MRKGSEYEDIAADYLEGLGYEILERNYHCRGGEIDIVAKDGKELVFVEVKGGRTEEFGHPLERFNRRKLSRIIYCAFQFMEERNIEAKFRVDLIVVLRDRVEHCEPLRPCGRSFW